jgi:hypothetical protein
VTVADDPARTALLRRGLALEHATLGWNIAGIIVLAFAAVAARSVALAGFGLDSLIEIGASTMVIWMLSGTGEQRQRRGLRLSGTRSPPWPSTCWPSPRWSWSAGITRGTRYPGSSGPRRPRR